MKRLWGFLILAMALAAGCDDDTRPGAVDVDTLDQRDDADGADTADTAAAPSPYDPALADLGSPATTCPLDVVTSPGADGRSVRVFLPSYRIDLAALVSHAAFREQIHRQIFDHVLPCLAPDVPNLVVFPESMSMPMVAIGPKATTARAADVAGVALVGMAGVLAAPLAYYDAAFPGQGLATRVLLALNDTVARATYDTFAQLADRYDLFVSVTVDLPRVRRTTDPVEIAAVGDPDLTDLTSAWVATSPEVYNAQLLFGPDGELLDRTEKTYVTLVEQQMLAIAPGDFTRERPMQTPWGLTGVVISKPAWMPDIQDRLDDLGTVVHLQPEAFVGGWATPPRLSDQTTWNPDVFMLGGWNLVQRSPRAQVNLVPQLTGNFFELAFDGQVQVIEKSTRNPASGRFVGQEADLAGNVIIGPWVVPDPGEADPSLSLQARREALRALGDKLMPGSGDPMEGSYVEGWWAIDVQTFAGGATAPDVQTHPDAARLGDALLVVSSVGVPGARHLRVERYDADLAAPTATWEHSPAGGESIRPSIAVDGAGRVHIVAELVGEDANPLYYVRLDADTGAFSHAATLPSAGDWAFHPDLLAAGDALLLGAVVRQNDANRATVLAGDAAADSPFAQATAVEIEPRPMGRAVLYANQWDVRLAREGDRVVATWIDFKNWQWEVTAAISEDAGSTWSSPVRVDDVPDGIEAIHGFPAVASLGADLFVFAWTDQRGSRANSRVMARFATVAAGGAMSLQPVLEVDDLAVPDAWAWRPALAVDADGGARVVFEQMDADGSRSLHQAALVTTATPSIGQPAQVATVADASLHLPVAVGAGGTAPAAVVYEVVPAFAPSSQVRALALP